MNAIIGRELLPTGLLPLTSVVTMLRFGPTERLLLTRDESWVEEAPISRLADYVTERGNPGNVKKIRAAYLDLPLSVNRDMKMYQLSRRGNVPPAAVQASCVVSPPPPRVCP